VVEGQNPNQKEEGDMSIVLRNLDKDGPRELRVKTWGLVPQTVCIGPFEISLEDFLIAADYVLTSTALEPHDLRLLFVKYVRAMKEADDSRRSEKRLEAFTHLGTFFFEKKLLRIAEIAVELSGGRLHLATGDEDAQPFLTLDGKRLGADINVYRLMATTHPSGQLARLTSFLSDIILPLKNELPHSYRKASKALRALGESICPDHLLGKWQALFFKNGR